MRHLPHIEIAVIKHRDQDYDTAGNYKEISKLCWEVSISRMPDWRYEFLVLIHELVEMALTRKNGVQWHKIDEWDLAHPESDDPGALAGCPYWKEHKAAERVERFCAILLGVEWVKYQRNFDKLKWRKRRKK